MEIPQFTQIRDCDQHHKKIRQIDLIDLHTSVLSKTASREQTVEIVNPGHEEAFRVWMTQHVHLQMDYGTSRSRKINIFWNQRCLEIS